MVNKITSPITPLEEVAKINEVIDAIPTESTVSGWGFTKNAGTVTSVNNVSPVNGNVSLTIPTVNNATLTITQGGTTKGTFTANASSDVTIALDAGGGSSGSAVRNIGEIVTSTIPLSDAGLHLLDGSVISGSGSYSAFVTYIAGLVSGHSELFATESDWQTSVTNYGVCGKFVYDSVNNTVRLPKYGSQIISSLPQDITVKGNGKTIGVTDGTTNYGLLYKGYNNSYTGEYGTNVGTVSSTGSNPNNSGITLGITTDPTKSGIIANTSDIPTEDCYYYIVIATTTKTDIQVDIDEVMTDLNGKVDKSGLAPVQCIIETYHNGTDWYRIWSDGWIEQGGEIAASTTSVTLLKPYLNTNYSVVMSGSNYGGSDQPLGTSARTISGFTVSTSSYRRNWYACGY